MNCDATALGITVPRWPSTCPEVPLCSSATPPWLGCLSWNWSTAWHSQGHPSKKSLVCWVMAVGDPHPRWDAAGRKLWAFNILYEKGGHEAQNPKLGPGPHVGMVTAVNMWQIDRCDNGWQCTVHQVSCWSIYWGCLAMGSSDRQYSSGCKLFTTTAAASLKLLLAQTRIIPLFSAPRPTHKLKLMLKTQEIDRNRPLQRDEAHVFTVTVRNANQMPACTWHAALPWPLPERGLCCTFGKRSRRQDNCTAALLYRCGVASSTLF